MTFLAKNDTFWDMYIENDPKPQNIGYLRGFDEKKSKKNLYVFWEPCASKCPVKFRVFDFIAKNGKKIAFFGGK